MFHHIFIYFRFSFFFFLHAIHITTDTTLFTCHFRHFFIIITIIFTFHISSFFSFFTIISPHIILHYFSRRHTLALLRFSFTLRHTPCFILIYAYCFISFHLRHCFSYTCRFCLFSLFYEMIFADIRLMLLLFLFRLIFTRLFFFFFCQLFFRLMITCLMPARDAAYVCLHYLICWCWCDCLMIILPRYARWCWCSCCHVYFDAMPYFFLMMIFLIIFYWCDAKSLFFWLLFHFSLIFHYLPMMLTLIFSLLIIISMRLRCWLMLSLLMLTPMPPLFLMMLITLLLCWCCWYGDIDADIYLMLCLMPCHAAAAFWCRRFDAAVFFICLISFIFDDWCHWYRWCFAFTSFFILFDDYFFFSTMLMPLRHDDARSILMITDIFDVTFFRFSFMPMIITTFICWLLFLLFFIIYFDLFRRWRHYFITLSRYLYLTLFIIFRCHIIFACSFIAAVHYDGFTCYFIAADIIVYSLQITPFRLIPLFFALYFHADVFRLCYFERLLCRFDYAMPSRFWLSMPWYCLFHALLFICLFIFFSALMMPLRLLYFDICHLFDMPPPIDYFMMLYIIFAMPMLMIRCLRDDAIIVYV